MKPTALLLAITALSACEPTPPMTYGDVANREEAQCRRKHPDAPASYCREQGLLSAAKDLCKDKPWLCQR